MCCSESTWLKPRGFAAQPCPALVSPMALRCPAAMNPDPHHLCCTSSLNYRLFQLVAAFSYSSPGLHTCSNPTARATRGPLGLPGSAAAAVHRRRGSSFTPALLCGLALLLADISLLLCENDGSLRAECAVIHLGSGFCRRGEGLEMLVTVKMVL